MLDNNLEETRHIEAISGNPSPRGEICPDPEVLPKDNDATPRSTWKLPRQRLNSMNEKRCNISCTLLSLFPRKGELGAYHGLDLCMERTEPGASRRIDTVTIHPLEL